MLFVNQGIMESGYYLELLSKIIILATFFESIFLAAFMVISSLRCKMRMALRVFTIRPLESAISASFGL